MGETVLTVDKLLKVRAALESAASTIEGEN